MKRFKNILKKRRERLSVDELQIIYQTLMEFEMLKSLSRSTQCVEIKRWPAFVDDNREDAARLFNTTLIIG